MATEYEMLKLIRRAEGIAISLTGSASLAETRKAKVFFQASLK